jgi:hypothetical protein
MTHRLPLALALAAALLGGGCGTIHNIRLPTVEPPDAPTAKVCRIYGGIRGDVPIIFDYPLSKSTELIDYVAIPLLAANDIVWSTVGDTITLPYTALETLRRYVHHHKAKSSAPGEVVVEESIPPIPATPPAAPLPLPPPTPLPAVPPTLPTPREVPTPTGPITQASATEEVEDEEPDEPDEDEESVD